MTSQAQLGITLSGELDRTVAIKVLPEHVADDPDLRQRFEREAKTISSLNHPHICTLHDIGQQDGTLGNCCCTLANTWARIVAPSPPRLGGFSYPNDVEGQHAY